jgi:hypothetical protein
MYQCCDAISLWGFLVTIETAQEAEGKSKPGYTTDNFEDDSNGWLVDAVYWGRDVVYWGRGGLEVEGSGVGSN